MTKYRPLVVKMIKDLWELNVVRTQLVLLCNCHAANDS